MGYPVACFSEMTSFVDSDRTVDVICLGYHEGVWNELSREKMGPLFFKMFKIGLVLGPDNIWKALLGPLSPIIL